MNLKEMIYSPAEKIQDSASGFSEAIKISAYSGLALGLLISLQLVYLNIITLSLVPAVAITGVIIGLIGPAMSAVSVHPLIYYFGGRKWEDTYKCFAFLTPHSLIGSVPGLNVLGLPAVFGMQINALKQTHDLEWSKAILAALIPGIGLAIIGIIVLAGIRVYTGFL